MHAGKQNLANEVDWYLGYDASADITGRASLGPESRFKLKPLSLLERAMVQMYRQGQDVAKAPVFMDEVDLSPAQKLHFVEQGFVHVPNVVPAQLVDDALKVINAQLLSENSMEYNNLGHLVLAGGVGHSDEIKRLLYASPAYTLAQRLVGKGQLTTCRLLFACLLARLRACLLAARPLGCLPISTCQLPLRPAKPSRRRADSAARPRARHPAHDGRQELAH